MDDAQYPTRGQLERQLSQRIQAWYRTQLGHQPSKVTCQLFDDALAILLEDAVTQPEQLLVDNGQEELAEQVRSNLDEVIQPHLKTLIEEVINVKVVEILSDAKLNSGRTGMIAVLSETPQVRNPTAIPKGKPFRKG